jgi:hypothetical protein
MSDDGSERLLAEIERRANLEPNKALEMAHKYSLGMTLDEIGKLYGVTRERVRQLINKATPWSPKQIRAAAADVAAREAERLALEDRELVLAWSRRHLGAPIEDAVDALGLPVERIHRALGRRRSAHSATHDLDFAHRRSDEDLLGDIRRFHRETGLTSALEFSSWAKAHGLRSHQTVVHRFDSWNRALQLAGVSQERQVQRDRRHSDTDLWAAAYLAFRAGALSARDVETWLRDQPHLPSLALVRARLKIPFASLKRTALEIVAGNSQRDPEWVAEVTRDRDWAGFALERDPLDDIRDARLALGPRITMAAYREWASANGRPGTATLLRRSGRSWAELLALVGAEQTKSAAHLRIPDAELLAWLAAFLRTEGSHSQVRYQSWARQHGAPTWSTLTMRFGSWSAAKAIALEFEG